MITGTGLFIFISVICCSCAIAEEILPHPTETTPQEVQNDVKQPTTVLDHILAVSASSSKENAPSNTNAHRQEDNLNLVPNEMKKSNVNNKHELKVDGTNAPKEVTAKKFETMSPREGEKLRSLIKAMRLNLDLKDQHKKMMKVVKSKQVHSEHGDEENEDERPLPFPDSFTEAIAKFAGQVAPAARKKCYKAFLQGSEKGPMIFGNVANTLNSRLLKMMLLFFRAPISLTAGAFSYVNCMIQNAGSRSFEAALKLADRARGGLKFVNRVMDSLLLNDRGLAREMAQEEANE